MWWFGVPTNERVWQSEDDAGDLVEDVMEKDFIEQEESFFAELFDPSNPSAMKVVAMVSLVVWSPQLILRA